MNGMKTEELELLIVQHEMSRLELKESFDVECIETACAFANAAGGYVIIGVDNSGQLSKRQLRFEALRDYENRIATATEPCVAVDAEKVEFHGCEVVVLKVQENPLKPVAYRGRCFIRKGSVNHQMSPVEIAECHLKSTGGSMDAVFVPGATRDDLSMEAVRRYMARAVANKRRNFLDDDDPWETLLKLEWVKSDSEITRAAYLLFAKEPQRKFSQAIVHSGAFKAGDAVIYDSHDSKGNVQDQVDDALAFVQKNIRCALEITAGKAAHEPKWEYPLEAVRETLANAICHRDYAAPYDVQVEVLEESLRISSPGALPFDMPMDFLMNPIHPSRPRNKIIAQAFFDMGVIERYGSGIRRIKTECDRNGNAYPTWTDGHGTFVTEYQKRALSTAAPKPTSDTSDEMPKAQSAEIALKTALKIALKTGGKSDADEIVGKIVAVRDELRRNPRSSLSAIAAALKLSERMVDDYVGALKSIGALRRKDGKKMGEWEVLK